MFQKVSTLVLVLLATLVVFANADAQAATLSGKLSVHHADSKNFKHADQVLVLERGKKRPLTIKLKRHGKRVIGPNGRRLNAKALSRFDGARVKVSGRISKYAISRAKIRVLAKAPARARTASAGPKKIAVVLMNFIDDRSRPFSTEDARKVFFTQPDGGLIQPNTPASVNQLFKEQSGYGLGGVSPMNLIGKTRADGDVFGWVEMPVRRSSGCYPTSWGWEANQRLAAQGVDLGGYDGIVYLQPPSSRCGSSFAGTGYAYVVDGLAGNIIAHELGHVFGLDHASRWDCTNAGATVTVAANANCSHVEYGDPYDFMGGSFNHLSGPHLTLLGTMPQANTVTASTFGTYTIKSSDEILPSGSQQVLRIPRSYDTTAKPYYYLEYRQPAGQWDRFSTTEAVTTGLSVRLGQSYSVMDTRGPAGEENVNVLLDATPESPGNYPLPVGRSIYDPLGNFTITLTSLDASGATISYQAGVPAASRSTARITSGVMTFNAATGQSNNVSVTKPDASTLRVTDNSQPITPTSPCTTVTANQVNCPTSGVTAVRLNGNDGNDVLRSTTGLPTILDGGTGDDALTGDTAADQLLGGAGADTLKADDSSADQVNCGTEVDVAYSDSADTLTDCDKANPGVVTLNNGQAMVNAAPGNRDSNITASLSGSELTVTDSTAPLIGDGNLCKTAATSVICGAGWLQYLHANLDDGNDTFAPNLPGVGTSAQLGAGTDVYVSGPQPDGIYGDSSDTASYAGRTTPVSVTLGYAGNDDGAPGENDNVGLDVGTVLGGAGDDTLKVDPNVYGHHTLNGAAGNDSLTASGFSPTTLVGGSGNDALDGHNGVTETLNCGADADYANTEGADTLTDCETPDYNPDTRFLPGYIPEGYEVSTSTVLFKMDSRSNSFDWECQLDGFVWTQCGSEPIVGPMSDGAHTLAVRSIDNLGRVDQSPAVRHFSVNTAEPQTTITSGPSGTVATSSPTFEFSSNKPGSSFECSDVASGAPDAFGSCTSPKTLSALPDGARVFKVRAIDNGSRTDSTPASSNYTVDTTGPVLSITSGPNDGVEVPGPASVTFTFASSEPNSTYLCSLDGVGFSPCSTPYTTPVLGAGDHWVSVMAVDALGNHTWETLGRSWRITTAPTVPTSASVLRSTVGTFTTPVTLSGTGSDLDWTHWGNSSVNSGVPGLDRKSSGGGAISDYTKLPVGTSTAAARVTTGSPAMSWTGGSPTATGSSMATGNAIGGAAGRGFRVTAPAVNTQARVLKLYVGVTGATLSTARGSMTASLSDGSAVNVTDTSVTSSSSTATNRVYTITYRSTSANATLQVDWTQQTSTSSHRVRLYGTQLGAVSDTTSPDTSISSGPAAGSTVTTSTASFGFTSTEPTNGRFLCNLDNAAYVSCTSPWTTPTLTSGSHTVRFTAIDQYGNVDQSPATRTFSKN